MASTCAQLPTLTVIITRPPLPRRWRNPHLSCLWPSGVRLSHTLPKVLDVFCLFGLCFCCRFQLPVANSTGNVGLTPAVAALFGRPTWSYWLCFVGPATPTPHHWVDPFFFFLVDEPYNTRQLISAWHLPAIIMMAMIITMMMVMVMAYVECRTFHKFRWRLIYMASCRIYCLSN